MKLSVRLKRADKGLRRVGNLLRSMRDSGSTVKVGLVGDSEKAKRADGSLTNPELGIVHEFGTSTIPARPFIGPGFRKHEPEYKQLLQTMVTKLVRTGKRSHEDVLGLIGAKAAADLKLFVTQGEPIPPPNSEKTIQRKGSSRTLVDTGRMVDAITWKIVRKDSLKGGSK